MKPKFCQQIVGKNMLRGLVQKFCSEAGFKGFYTGHSGKVTCATELFGNMVDEQLIQQYTGHCSTESVRQYKRASDDHFKLVTRILQPPPAKVCAFCSQNDSGPSVSFKHDDDQENRSADDATKQIVAQQSHGAVGIASTPSTPHFRSPLENLSNSIGSATIQATNGGNMTFNFNFH